MAQVGPAPVGSQLVADLDALLEGVTEIAAPGVPGPLLVYGPEAFPVVVGSTGGARAPVVAAGRWQVGRVVALGHDGYFGYFNRTTLETADTGRLISNALRWAAGVASRAGPRIGVVRSERTDELLAWLRRTDHDAREIALTPEPLGGVDVVAVATWNQSDPEIEALSAFVRAGGGLVTAATGWGWAYLHPAQDLVKDFAGNRLLAPVGIQWADDTLARTSPDGYRVDGPPPRLTHASTALDAVEAHESGRHTLTEQERVQAIDTLTRFVRALPADDPLLAPRLRVLAETSRDRWPSAEQPVGEADLGLRLAATRFMDEQKRISPESVRAHPAAEDFPGPVPAAAPRITRTLAIDTTVPRWHSTGLYAPPGELITVKAPPEAAATDGFGIRVGVHSDRIWHQAEWKRMPEISRRFPISAATTRVANAFGGLIYVEVPVEADLGTITVEIEGAVAAPRFVLGETDPEAWRDEIRHAPAPWAEIEGRNMIVTTDSREVRGLGDPTAVAEVWDRVLDLNAQLAAWSSPRRYPERFVVDRQISAGYMHAGYPLMAHLDQSANLVDASHIATCRYDPTQSNWGFFHEVGHNHQSPDWTFDGTVEVTVNLFTLYAYEFLCGIPVAQNWRGSAVFRAEQMARYDFDSPDFEQWKRDPFLALVMYVQLQQEFGWEAYRSVFATYRALPDEERPKNDIEKRDQWLVRFSRQVGRNLGPFFAAWGVPTSRAARDSIADLPTWLPNDFQLPAPDDHGNDAASASQLALNSSRSGRIETPSDEDWFRLETSGPRAVRIRTTGGLNTVGTLFDTSGRELTSDDDGGNGFNFSLEVTVAAGVHYVRVKGFGSATGSYTIHENGEPAVHPDVSGASVITTVAGSDRLGDDGDGGSATGAQLALPTGVAVDATGNLYIADRYKHRVRKVDSAGVITTVAGTGVPGYGGDGGPGASAQLAYPEGVAVDTAGNLYITDTGNHRVRKVDATGMIATVAGTGVRGYAGDGGPATSAQFEWATGVAVDSVGNLYIADQYNYRVRKVDSAGVITTVAGTGVPGYGGDGGPGASAQLAYPKSVAVDTAGNLYIADSWNHRVRKVDATGMIATVAGVGVRGYAGEGDRATRAQLAYPEGVAVDTAGNLYIADSWNHRVRKVDATGMITTVVGTGVAGYGGDGGPATNARLANPTGVAVDGLGNLYIADALNRRVRKITGIGGVGTAPPVVTDDHGDIAALIPPIVMEAGGRVSLDIAAYFNDLDSNTLTYSARWPAFVAGVPLTVTGTLIESMATIWAVDEGEVEITFTAADASLSVSQDVHVTTTLPVVPTGTPSLRVIYAIPSDKEWRQPYSDAIQQAIEAIQAWYLHQLDGQTFAIHASVPESCHLGKPEAWFKEYPVSDWQKNTWARLREALQACVPIEDGFDQDHIWLVYADILEECDPVHGTALGRGWNGITMIGGQDLRALTDSTYVVGPHCYGGSFGRWLGGLAHELGHGFNLLHPPGCDSGLQPCDYRAVMAQGLYSWPDAHLRAEDEIPNLLANRFIRKP